MSVSRSRCTITTDSPGPRRARGGAGNKVPRWPRGDRRAAGAGPAVLLEPGVGGVGRAGEGLGPRPAAAAEAPLRSIPHAPELLAVPPDDLERRLADVAAVERRA